MIALTPTVTLVELIWTIMAVGGLGFVLWALWDSWQDVQLGRELPDEATLGVAARMGLRVALAGVALHSFFILLGVPALLTPNPRESLADSLLGFYAIVVITSNVVAVALNQRDRHRARRSPISSSKEIP